MTVQEGDGEKLFLLKSKENNCFQRTGDGVENSELVFLKLRVK